mmetsp:Transcript_2529/g.7187  ORF Transcript_2529/g.7187 Transcript_2529/m.7187 type:complete len:237 (-) Transcript_2529:120-830(-)
MCVVVPPRALKEETVDIATVLRLLCDGQRISLLHLIVPRDGVDGDDVLASVVLHRACEEGLREEKAGDPEGGRSTVGDPVLEEANACLQVHNPSRQRLEVGVGLLGPHGRHLVVEERSGHGVKFLRHDYETLQRLHQVLQATVEEDDETIEALALLGEHCVHGLRINQGVLLHHLIELKGFKALVQNALGCLRQDVVTRLACATRNLGLERQERLAHLVGLVLRTRNVCILVQAKH